MNFIENLKEIMGANEIMEGGAVKFTVVIEKGGYFENVKGVLSYSDDLIVLKIKGGKISVKGENLFIKKYCEGDLSICGKITSVEKD